MSKVLVVEDDKFLCKAYKLKLEKEGFEVTLAEDGEEALKALGESKPDAILLDLVMPKMDGFATLVEIKKKDEWKKIPVIVASNLGQKEDRDRAEEAGADDFVVKSDMALEKLVELVKKWVAKDK